MQLLKTFFIALAMSTFASAGSDSIAAAPKCPLSGKCPHYEKIAKSRAESIPTQRDSSAAAEHSHGCPLKGKNCPYFDQHSKEHSLLDIVQTEDHKCPLSSTKCPFYHNIKSDNVVPSMYNWEASKCPLAAKCPYYDDIKKNNGKALDCPVLHGCPHFKKKDSTHQVHHDHNAAEAAHECPYLKKEKEKKKLEDSAHTAGTIKGTDKKFGSDIKTEL
ncbi:hypothetical protein QVD99_003826 [Batrachochytrium dendrobatidis]|nr:hypothetical protein QVD99_003826 [Batrachochytrium dendrobatidis]